MDGAVWHFPFPFSFGIQTRRVNSPNTNTFRNLRLQLNCVAIRRSAFRLINTDNNLFKIGAESQINEQPIFYPFDGYTAHTVVRVCLSISEIN